LDLGKQAGEVPELDSVNGALDRAASGMAHDEDDLGPGDLAGSMLPRMSSLATLPATRALNTSPMPRSMIISAGAPESMQLKSTAAGYCPFALAFCCAR